jgi:hypothetical protein
MVNERIVASGIYVRVLVKERLLTTLVTLEEAKEYRLQLMKERTAFETDHSLAAYNQTFNMCEH